MTAHGGPPTNSPKESAALVSINAGTSGSRRRPHAALRRTVNRLGRADEWRDVIKQSPTVMPFAMNVARYLTESVPTLNGEQSLLAHCVTGGMDTWQIAYDQAEPERRRFLAFIRGVLYPLPHALEWTLSRRDGRHITEWNPIEQCVSDWWAGKGSAPEATWRKRPEDTAYVAMNPADYRLIVLVRFLARDPISLTPLSAQLDELVARYG